MRAVIITAQGVQDEEFIYPYYRLQEAGFDLDVVIVQESVHSFGCTGKYGIPIKGSMLPVGSDFQVAGFDLAIIPGGWEAPERVRQSDAVLKFLQDMDKEGKTIGAICHGPSVLISAGIVKGRKMTCYRGMKDDLANAGALYEDSCVVVDRNIVTAPHYRNNPEFMREVLGVASERWRLSTLVLA